MRDFVFAVVISGLVVPSIPAVRLNRIDVANDYPYKSDISLPSEVTTGSLVPILQAFLPDFDAKEQFSFKPLTGGVTNQMLLVNFANGRPKVLVRIFGGEGLIDRDEEGMVLEVLDDNHIVPKVYGRFANGRVEAFIENARDMRYKDLPNWALQIARSLRQIHSTILPEELQGPKGSLWTTIMEWKGSAKEFLNADATCATSPWRTHSIAAPIKAFLHRADGEVDHLRREMPLHYKEVFCHMDLHGGNIMLVDNSKVQVIDFEYAGMNFRGFDIANHWCEYCFDTVDDMSGVAMYDKFPDIQKREEFIEAYLGPEASETEVRDLRLEAEAFVPVDHIFWGLWAVRQAMSEGCQEFDYLQYALTRFEGYDAKLF